MKTLVLRFLAIGISLSALVTAHAEISHSDKSFLEKAAKSGMEEVAISTGAIDRLGHEDIKSFAQMMVADHTKANSELMALAGKKGVVLPPKDKHFTELTDKWSKKTTDVDSDYVKQMLSDHEDAVNLFAKAAKSEDADVSAFAAKTLPTLQHHLDMVRGFKAGMK